MKWFAITDEYTRECLALEVDRSITSDRVQDILTNLFLTRGVPQHIQSDNGPEFIAKAIQGYDKQAGLEMLYIEPGAPWENGFAESFFSRLKKKKESRKSGKRLYFCNTSAKWSPDSLEFRVIASQLRID